MVNKSAMGKSRKNSGKLKCQSEVKVRYNSLTSRNAQQVKLLEEYNLAKRPRQL